MSTIREVADALATRRTVNERMDAAESLADASAQTLALVESRFRNGVETPCAGNELSGARLA